jgi:hypothetical protein
MPDPVIRRLPCEATLYIETHADGLSLSRLVVDVAMPDPSVIVGNLPPSFHPDRGDAWEGEDVEPELQPRSRPVLLSVEGLPASLRAEVS